MRAKAGLGGGVEMARKRFVTSEISTDRKIAKLAENSSQGKGQGGETKSAGQCSCAGAGLSDI